MTFAKLFKKWYEHYARTVTKQTAKITSNYLDTHLPDSFWQADITDIKSKTVLDVAAKTAKTSTYYAKRLVADVARIYDFGVVMGYVDTNPASCLMRYKPKHITCGFAHLPPAKMPALFAEINCKTKPSLAVKNAFWLIVYTGVRRAEATNALKSEFDFECGTWTIPAGRMKIKGNGEHIVYLAPQIATMLQDYFASHNSKYAFPSCKSPNKPITTWSPYYMIKATKYVGKQTLHGFRKVFSTHAHESGLWTIDSIELSLAHKIGGVRGVYNHAQMSDERRKLMAWYANEVDKWRGMK